MVANAKYVETFEPQNTFICKSFAYFQNSAWLRRFIKPYFQFCIPSTSCLFRCSLFYLLWKTDKNFTNLLFNTKRNEVQSWISTINFGPKKLINLRLAAGKMMSRRECNFLSRFDCMAFSWKVHNVIHELCSARFQIVEYIYIFPVQWKAENFLACSKRALKFSF